MAVTIPFIRDFDPQYGQLVSVSDNVRRLVANNPGRFSAWGTNIYVVGHNEVSIIDPGPDTDAYFQTLISALNGERVTRVFVTHHHSDHSPMANRLAAHFGCPTLGFGPPRRQLASGNVVLEAGDDLAFSPQVKINDGEVFEGDGWNIEAVFTPGHTSNHVCYAVQGDEGLICGDHILGWATSVVIPPDGDMGEYLHSLEKVLARQYRVLWPGHGAAITDTKSFIKAYIAHREARNAQILAQLKTGQSQIKKMVPILYADVDKGLYPAASLSVLAHLIHMVQTGLVDCHGAPDLDSQYQLA